MRRNKNKLRRIPNTSSSAAGCKTLHPNINNTRTQRECRSSCYRFCTTAVAVGITLGQVCDKSSVCWLSSVNE